MLDLFVSDTLRFAHLLTVAVGFGVAVETETFMFRRRRTAISPGMLSGLDHRHRVILYAVGAMWVTGLALVALRTGFQLSAVTPKLWGKITVVTILSVNAIFVARVALPILAEHKGRRIADLPAAKKSALFSVAGVSAASWLVALALGSSAILKVSPAAVFQIGLPLAYIAGILGANWVGRRLFPCPVAEVAPEADAARPAPATEATAHAVARADSEPAPAQRVRAPKSNDEAGPIPPRQVSSAKPKAKYAAVPRPAVPRSEPRATDLAIAFAPNRRPGAPRLKVDPDEPKSTQAARERLASVLAEMGAR